MMNTKQHLELSDEEISSLTVLLKNGKLPARVFRRAAALLELSRGKALTQVARTLGVAYQTVAIWRDNYLAIGVDSLLDKPRSGRPVCIDGESRAKITALACSTAPDGHARWSLRLLADKAIELNLVEAVSHNQVGRILKKTN